MNILSPDEYGKAFIRWDDQIRARASPTVVTNIILANTIYDEKLRNIGFSFVLGDYRYTRLNLNIDEGCDDSVHLIKYIGDGDD